VVWPNIYSTARGSAAFLHSQGHFRTHALQQTTLTNRVPYSITSSATVSGSSGILKLGRGQIDDEIELSRLLDRKVDGLCAAQNFVNIISCSSEQV
jgi:hypothetical protein